MKTTALFAAALLAACASMPANDAATSLRAGAADFAAAANSGNLDRMMSIYADNAVLMPPNAPPFRGRDAIRQYWGGFLGAGKIDATIAADDVVQSCDMATEVGHYALTITPKGAAPIKDSGKYVITWKRIGGQWRAVYDIFNSDLPLPR
ncbi:MAG TPA: DUF4440 domain-containing protein [Thermoanaerobaculia bacterium]|nr:DUF4440 domain-containing protein [Thermoanaerobaculia bacterium]